MRYGRTSCSPAMNPNAPQHTTTAIPYGRTLCSPAMRPCPAPYGRTSCSPAMHPQCPPCPAPHHSMATPYGRTSCSPSLRSHCPPCPAAPGGATLARCRRAADHGGRTRGSPVRRSGCDAPCRRPDNQCSRRLAQFADQLSVWHAATHRVGIGAQHGGIASTATAHRIDVGAKHAPQGSGRDARHRWWRMLRPDNAAPRRRAASPCPAAMPRRPVYGRTLCSPSMNRPALPRRRHDAAVMPPRRAHCGRTQGSPLSP
jgi:hypothetical protein